MIRNESTLADKIDITEVINYLFMYADASQWKVLTSLVFAPEIDMDRTSMGTGKSERLTIMYLMWDERFTGLDAIHHQAGNYLIEIGYNKASVWANTIAANYKAFSVNRKTWTFVQNYEFHLIGSRSGWRINGFTSHLKYKEGNMSLE